MNNIPLEILKIDANTSKARSVININRTHGFLRNFYRKYLKKIWPFRHVYIILFKSYVACHYIYKKLTLHSTYKITSLANYCFYESCHVYKYLSCDIVKINQPKVYPSQQQSLVQMGTIIYSIPPTYVAVIDDCTVIGGSNIFTSGRAVVLHDMFDIEADTMSEELHNKIVINVKNKTLSFTGVTDHVIELETAAIFLDATAQNYAHWLTEVLPKIIVFCSDDRFNSIPLLINDGLHGNILRSLQVILKSKRKIYAVNSDARIHVNRLFCSSQLGYVPFGRRKGYAYNYSDGIFNPDALERVRDLVRSKLLNNSLAKIPNSNNPIENLYVKRVSSIRNLTNQTDLEVALNLLGFVTIEPERLTFDEQVYIFSNAKFIVGVTGAAMANCIFCNRNTKVGILISKHSDMIYKYWSNILDPLGVNVSYVIGDSSILQSAGIHSDFSVNIQDVKEMVSEWRA